MKTTVDIIKSSGEKVKFSIDKLRKSLLRSGAKQATVDEIVDIVVGELYENISTKEIYNRAFALLRKEKSYLASKYKLKRAIYELGPTGFPFERFISAILMYSGYTTEVDKVLQGHCISHEVDVVATKNNSTTIVECKFHSEKNFKCNVKVPLYINSRYNDIKTHWDKNPKNTSDLTEGWVVTNTRFTEDALKYGQCVNLYLLSWDYPGNNGLKDRIDRLGLYPITVSTLLTQREKQFLLSRDVVLCRQLVGDAFYLDHLGISEKRKEKILNEINMLCHQ
ncbi:MULTISPECIES: ATP cone domain-containing protein [Aestuariibaculum]|uniref:ATP cone domain-containing protein n=1 Tax=Aestuariibaculum lutulentum TaxID=2920935 RepID=A0ABS9RJF7_9FLAO|nr:MULTISPECIES: ATP cone domain-containing protein [Aestuariibaculum]MCH4553078.1 ATP cone domain-containing protein [Aestuariibaculum lutulentum]MCR8668991.1 ATP cone domain-containing protein [Aestuariibaculum sp. M13]